MSDDNQGSGPNRRNVLKYTGTAMAGLTTALAVAGTAGAASTPPGVFVTKGTFENPVTQTQAENARQAAREHYQDRTGKSHEVVAFGSVDRRGPSDEQAADDVTDVVPRTVGHVVTITDEGPSEYIGSAAAPQNVLDIHKRVGEKAQEFAQKQSQQSRRHLSRLNPGASANTNSNGTFRMGDPSGDYSRLTDAALETDTDYGRIYQSWILWMDSEDDGDDVWWVLENTYEQVSGWELDREEYCNYKMTTAHRWNHGDHVIKNFHEHFPNGDDTGSWSKSYSIGGGAGSVSMTYSQPDVSRDDDSILSDDYTRYVFTPNSGSYIWGKYQIQDVSTDVKTNDYYGAQETYELVHPDHAGTFEVCSDYVWDLVRLHNNDVIKIYWQ